MTIIRNDRRQREAREHEAAASREASEEDESVDLRWHPTADELPNPISTERWEELLGDPSVFDEDGMHAVECLNDYGGPATLQQLSVRYRGTMGRYRKWLNGVAERAARHEGRESMGTDQFGREEWWPYLYRQRIVGKAAANVYEMVLQPELVEALRKREEAKSAERKRQLEAEAEATRARNAEQRRARLEAAAKAQEAAKAQAAAREAEERKRAQTAAQAQTQVVTRPESATATPPEPSRPAAGATKAAVPAARPGRGGVVLDLPETPQPQGKDPAATVAPAGSGNEPALGVSAASRPAAPAPLAADDALVAFLTTMEGIQREGEANEPKPRRAPGTRPSQGKQASWRPLDYAHRYADRLADALELMADGLPGLTVACVARELGDESVEELAGYLNGSSTPGFAYLRRLCDLLLVSEDRLEAPESRAADLPVFCTLRERFGAAGAARRVWGGAREVVFVTDDSRDRRSGVIVRFSDLSCGLLERTPVSADADRYSDPALSAYVRLVREVDGRAEAGSLARSARKVSAKEWDALAAGLVWPGLFC